MSRGERGFGERLWRRLKLRKGAIIDHGLSLYAIEGVRAEAQSIAMVLLRMSLKPGLRNRATLVQAL